MELAKLQNGLKDKGVTYRGYELLLYMKKNYFKGFKGIELQRLRPLAFSESKLVKQGFEELVNANVISGEYKNGIAFNIIPNIELLSELEDMNVEIKVVKTAPAKKSSKKEIPDDILSIIKYYNEFPELPRPATATPLVISRIEEKLKFMPVEQIKEAIEYASTQRWLIAKGEEKWCSMSWVINAINEFSYGGKYRSTTPAQATEDKYTSMMDNDNVEVIW